VASGHRRNHTDQVDVEGVGMMSTHLDHRALTTRLVLISILAFALSPLFPLRARGCSCSIPSDIVSWVDESEAVVVGTLREA
jgi:hypothetical protein